jgi:hypothetical protein
MSGTLNDNPLKVKSEPLLTGAAKRKMEGSGAIAEEASSGLFKSLNPIIVFLTRFQSQFKTG